VDDGSTDDTEQLIAGLESDKITYIKQSNQGVCAARNHGAEKARGKYLVFLDSDDFLSLNYLLNYYCNLNNSKFRLALGDIIWCDKNGLVLECVNARMNEVFFTQPLSGSFAIDSKLFKIVGGYDLNLTYSETSDLFISIYIRNLINLEEVIIVSNAGVHIEKVNRRARRTKYAEKHYLSTKYFLKKHTEYFSMYPGSYINYQKILSVSALLNNNYKEAKNITLFLVKNNPYNIKYYLQYLLVCIFPYFLKKYYSKL